MKGKGGVMKGKGDEQTECKMLMMWGVDLVEMFCL